MAVTSAGVLRALAEQRRAGVEDREDGGSPFAGLADAAVAVALLCPAAPGLRVGEVRPGVPGVRGAHSARASVE